MVAMTIQPFMLNLSWFVPLRQEVHCILQCPPEEQNGIYSVLRGSVSVCRKYVINTFLDYDTFPGGRETIIIIIIMNN